MDRRAFAQRRAVDGTGAAARRARFLATRRRVSAVFHARRHPRGRGALERGARSCRALVVSVSARRGAAARPRQDIAKTESSGHGGRRVHCCASTAARRSGCWYGLALAYAALGDEAASWRAQAKLE